MWINRLLLATFLTMVVGTTFADDDQLLTITKSGYYLTVLGQDGTPSYVRLSRVVDLSGTKPAPEQPDKPDEPSVDKEVVGKVHRLAKAVNDPESAQAIAAVYAHIRGAIEDGTLDTMTAWQALKQATESALTLVGGHDWTSFRSDLTAIFTVAQQRGELRSAKQIDRMLLSVQRGVELAADGSTAISFERVVEIARRTNAAINGAKQ